jgi:RNA polymerase sigma factor (TIGR02999 family)
MGEKRHSLTRILQELDPQDEAKTEELMGVVYEELRTLARAHMSREGAAHTLQPTELVHEAYFRLVERPGLGWESRGHFFGAAARAMRQVLVDHARRRMADKRGGGEPPVTLSTEIASEPGVTVEILDLHRALTELEAQEPSLARLVELRFFAGLTVAEAATTLGVSPRKAAKDWSVVRLWLHRELKAD